MAESSRERPPSGPGDGFRRMMDSMQFETLPLFSKPHYSWNLKTDYVGRRFVYRPVSESTLDDAHRMLERFRLTNGALLLAETQTAGRGRAGRSWVSPPDVNLYFTLILTPPPEAVRALAYVSPLAVADAITEVAAAKGVTLKPDLKWPNDILIDGKKVGGVLIETTRTTDGTLVGLVGVGINVNLEVNDYPEIISIATSLKAAFGFHVPREEILAAFCNRFEATYERVLGGSKEPFAEWKRRLFNLGQPVVATGTDNRLEGVAVDVDADGALVIETADGHRVAVEAGDVTLSHG